MKRSPSTQARSSDWRIRRAWPRSVVTLVRSSATAGSLAAALGTDASSRSPRTTVSSGAPVSLIARVTARSPEVTDTGPAARSRTACASMAQSIRCGSAYPAVRARFSSATSTAVASEARRWEPLVRSVATKPVSSS